VKGKIGASFSKIGTGLGKILQVAGSGLKEKKREVSVRRLQVSTKRAAKTRESQGKARLKGRGIPTGERKRSLLSPALAVGKGLPRENVTRVWLHFSVL